MMKRLTLFLVATLASASAFAMHWDFSPYVGIDGGWRQMEFAKYFGGKQLHKSYSQGNIFVGTKFNSCFGIELGYTRSQKRNKNVTALAGDNYLGSELLDPGESNATDSQSSIRGFNINLMGFYPVWKDLELIGSVGASRDKLKAKFQPYNVDGTALTPTQQADAYRSFSKSKTVLLVRAGAEYQLMKHLGVRLLIGWENTSKFKTMTPEQANKASRASAKNSMNYSLGLSWHF